MTTIRDFAIDVPTAELDELRTRLERARLPRTVDEQAVEQGVSLADVRELVRYWREDFDWPAQEQALNALDQVLVEVDGRTVHAVHQRADRADRADAVPVVLLHGWPDSFVRYRHVAPRLVEAGHPVVVPSLPGTAWSEEPEEPLSLALAAESVHGLMGALGYERYAVHGGDWGSGVADALATAHPEAVLALHLSDVPFAQQFAVDREHLSPGEEELFARFDDFSPESGKGLYYLVQSLMPTVFSVGLEDSPVALATWHLSRFRMWSQAVSLDDVLTNVVVHWVTGCTRSAMRFYAESTGESTGAADWSDGGWDAPAAPSAPAGFALFPGDIAGVWPREYAERFYDVQRYTVMPRGGHFGALEEPGLLAEDLLGFLAQVAG